MEYDIVVLNAKSFECNGGNYKFTEEQLQELANQVKDVRVTLGYDPSKLVGRGIAGRVNNSGELVATLEIGNDINLGKLINKYCSIGYQSRANRLTDIAFIKQTCVIGLPKFNPSKFNPFQEQKEGCHNVGWLSAINEDRTIDHE